MGLAVGAVTTSSHSERARARYTKGDLDEILGCAVAFACLAVVLGCLGETPKQALAASKPDAPPELVAPLAGVSTQSAGERKGGRLGTALLTRFRADLVKLANHQATAPLRVLWLGDSHTAGISWPASLEASLLQTVASGGPGYIPLGLAYGRYHGAKVSAEESFDIAPHPPAKRAEEDDRIFGLGGTRVTPRNKSIGINLKLDPNLSRGAGTGQLIFRYKGPTDRIVISTDGKSTDVKREGTASFEGGIHAQSFPINPQISVDIRVLTGNPELFGVIVENDEPGLVIDVLGINGARFATTLAWDESAWTAQVRWRQPSLAVIAYGTNEVFDLVSPKRYAAEIRTLVTRIRSAAPESECILAGPTDVGRGGQIAEDRVREIDQVEAATAEALGCAYFSAYDAMGGMQGFDDWLHANPPLAVSDRIHLTAAGYRKLGQAMTESLFGAPP